MGHLDVFPGSSKFLAMRNITLYSVYYLPINIWGCGDSSNYGPVALILFKIYSKAFWLELLCQVQNTPKQTFVSWRETGFFSTEGRKKQFFRDIGLYQE